MIDRLTVDRIKEAANIVEVVSEFVTLKKSGANYKGLCPFHNEKTPSFMVSPARGTCKCFGCGKGGNPVSFIMEHEQLTYPEALRWLAKKYNIEIQERELSDEEKQSQNERESMFIVNDWTTDYFENILRNDPDGVAIGMQYFRGRGFRDDVIRKFRLGFDPKDRHALALAAKKAKHKDEFLLKTGICYQNDRGELIDRYSDRVIFPWIGLSGKVVGFSARVLDARTKGVQQKYVNSPDSEIFHKERELFGIYQAKKAIAREDRVFIVEGQTDVISMHQCGIENVVANSGTALSMHQIHMLHRFTSNITMLYDGDAAGIHAAMRGTDMLLSEGMNVKVLFLPDGEDPDSFARKHTATDFRQYVEDNQTDFIQFKINLLLNQAKDPQQRSEAIDSIVQSISVVPNQILRDTYLHEAAARTGSHEKTLISRMNTIIHEKQSGTNSQNTQNQTPNAQNRESSTPIASQVERMITQMIVRHGEHIIYENVEDEDGNMMNLTVAQFVYYNLSADNLFFEDACCQKILQEAVEQSGKEGFRAESYFLNHHDVEISKLANDLTIDHYALVKGDKEKNVVLTEQEQAIEREKTTSKLRSQAEHLMLDFRMDYVERNLKSLQQQLLSASSNPELTKQLLEQYREMQQIRNMLAKQVGLNIM